MNKHRLQSLLLSFALHMPNIIYLNLNYIIIDQRKLQIVCYVKFKETNQICSPLKISQPINAESACDGNNKSMYSCFYESKKFLSCLM